MDQKALNNRANQKNPNHISYWKSRGYSDRPANWIDLVDANEYDSDDSDSRNNRANQKNPNHISYWKSRGYSDRPDNWREIICHDEYVTDENSQTNSYSTNQDSTSSIFPWIIGGVVAGGLLAAVSAISTANREDPRENRPRNQRSDRQ